MPPTVNRDVVKRLNSTQQASGGSLGARPMQLPLRGVSAAISGETERTTDVVQVATATTSHYHLPEQPKLPSTFSDTSVEDHESEECDTRLATVERDFPRVQEEFLQTKAHGKLVHAIMQLARLQLG